jgi:hypothetical protein
VVFPCATSSVASEKNHTSTDLGILNRIKRDVL